MTNYALRAENNGIKLQISTDSGHRKYVQVTRESDGLIIYSGTGVPYEGLLKPLYARFNALPGDAMAELNRISPPGGDPGELIHARELTTLIFECINPQN